MNNKLLEYIRSKENKPMAVGTECNSMALNILYILYPENKNIKIIKDKILNCKTFKEVRPLIKQYGTVHEFILGLGYKEVEGRILPGDFLIKPRKYFDDVIYAVDSITYCGMAPLNQFNKNTQSFVISQDMHITTKHKIYRKGN